MKRSINDDNDGMTDRVNPDWLCTLRQRAPVQRRTRARDANLNIDDYVQQAESNIREWVDGAAIRIRIREEPLLSFLQAGRYQVMAVSGTSGGDLKTVDTRLAVEEQILGIPRTAPASARPISGYLEGSDESGAITTYGPIVMEVGGHVRPRAWFLLGDLVDTPRLSGGHTIAPRPLLDPSIEAANGRRDIASAPTLADACWPHGYAEVLIFGGLATADISTVTYIQGLDPSDEVRPLIASAGWTLAQTAGDGP